MMWLLEVQLGELAETRREGKEAESAEHATRLQRFLMRKNVHVSGLLFMRDLHAPKL